MSITHGRSYDSNEDNAHGRSRDSQSCGYRTRTITRQSCRQHIRTIVRLSVIPTVSHGVTHTDGSTTVSHGDNTQGRSRVTRVDDTRTVIRCPKVCGPGTRGLLLCLRVSPGPVSVLLTLRNATRLGLTHPGWGGCTLLRPPGSLPMKRTRDRGLEVVGPDLRRTSYDW